MTAPKLTAAQRSALLALAHAPMYRLRDGWGAGGKKITLATGGALRHAGLARSAVTGGRHKLVATPEGKRLAVTLEDRP